MIAVSFRIGVHGGQKETQARSFRRHRGMHDRLHIDAAFQEPLRKHHGRQRIRDDDGTDRGPAAVSRCRGHTLRERPKSWPRYAAAATRSGSRCKISSALSALAAITGGIATL